MVWKRDKVSQSKIVFFKSLLEALWIGDTRKSDIDFAKVEMISADFVNALKNWFVSF